MITVAIIAAVAAFFLASVNLNGSAMLSALLAVILLCARFLP
jgi:hypothetical protein